MQAKKSTTTTNPIEEETEKAMSSLVLVCRFRIFRPESNCYEECEGFGRSEGTAIDDALTIVKLSHDRYKIMPQSIRFQSVETDGRDFYIEELKVDDARTKNKIQSFLRR